jgi:Ca2+-binding EF-hand superfamily protein
MKFFEKVAKT